MKLMIQTCGTSLLSIIGPWIIDQVKHRHQPKNMHCSRGCSPPHIGINSTVKCVCYMQLITGYSWSVVTWLTYWISPCLPTTRKSMYVMSYPKSSLRHCLIRVSRKNATWYSKECLTITPSILTCDVKSLWRKLPEHSIIPLWIKAIQYWAWSRVELILGRWMKQFKEQGLQSPIYQPPCVQVKMFQGWECGWVIFFRGLGGSWVVEF